MYYEKDSFNIIEKRYEKDELQTLSKLWNNELIKSIDNIGEDWMDKLFSNQLVDNAFAE